jgi:hypothetical protein
VDILKKEVIWIAVGGKVTKVLSLFQNNNQAENYNKN